MATKIFADFEATPQHKILIKEALKDYLDKKLNLLCIARKEKSEASIKRLLTESGDISDLMEAL